MKATTIFLFAVIFCLGCDQKPNKNAEVIKETEYTKWLKQNQAQLSDSVRHYRDSIYSIYKGNPIYKKLYIEKNVSDNYVLIVEQLGYLLLTRTEHRFMLDDIRMKYIEHIPGAQEFLLDAGKLVFRGEYIPEFETLINAYIDKYGYYGAITNTLDGNKSKLTSFKYNLFFGKLYIDSKCKDALNSMAIASLTDWFKWTTTQTNDETGEYIHPEFVYEPEFFNYLKQFNAGSKFIIDYKVNAPDLNNIYHENEVIADKQFRGKKIFLTGTVTNISKNAFDQPYLTINTGKTLEQIHCKVSEEDALKLSKYQKIRLIGICNGMFMGSVMLEDCLIIE